MTSREYIIAHDQLYDSMTKCRCSVMWKPSVMSFALNDIENINRMEIQLNNGTWKNGNPRPIKITYPKKRDGLSISFRDRVYQRSINDNVLYPEMTRHFIYDNWACQTGKGPDKARDRVKKMLRKYYINHGTSEGWILQTDVKCYYPNMSHAAVKNNFKEYLPKDVHEMICDVLDTQYKGETGYNPGSQMVQIAGISLLDKTDHYIKEVLYQKYYLRYMDDSMMIAQTKEELESVLENLERKMKEVGCILNKKKTKIVPLSKGFTFLGFKYRLTETGKVVMLLTPENIKHERRKLRKMVAKTKRGGMERSKVDECYRSWKNHASKGNSYMLLRRMDKYYKELWKGANKNVLHKKDPVYQTGKGNGNPQGKSGKTA